MPRCYTLLLLSFFASPIFSVSASTEPFLDGRSHETNTSILHAENAPRAVTTNPILIEQIRDTSYVCVIKPMHSGKEDRKVYSGSLIQTSLGHKAILSSAQIYDSKATDYIAIFQDGERRILQNVVFYEDLYKGPESIAIGFLESYPESARPLVIGTYDEIRDAGSRHIREVAGHDVNMPEREGYFFPIKGQLSAYAPPLSKGFRSLHSVSTYFENMGPTFELKSLDRHLYYAEYEKEITLPIFSLGGNLTHQTEDLSLLTDDFTPLTSAPRSASISEEPLQRAMLGSAFVLNNTNHAVAIYCGRPNFVIYTIFRLLYPLEIFILSSVLTGCALGGNFTHNTMAYGVMIPFGIWWLSLVEDYFTNPIVNKCAYFEGDLEEYAPIYHIKNIIEHYINRHYGA